jgi:hypothetical protein
VGLSAYCERYTQLTAAGDVEFLDVDDSWSKRKFPYLMADFDREMRE